jgi:hypothetical protein
MVSETLIWTALPAGLSGDAANRRLRLSAFLSPRLQTDQQGATLALFPNFLDWPSKLQAGQATFSVRLRTPAGAPPSAPVPATIVSAAPDSALWTALVDRSTTVESHTYEDMTGRAVSSFSIASLHNHIKDGHQFLAVNSPVGQPTFGVLRQTMGGLMEAMAPSGQPVIAAPGLVAGADPAALSSLLSNLATNMFRPDGVTDVDQRVSTAILNARRLAAMTPGQPVHVLPSEGSAASEFARLTAFHRGPAFKAATAPLSGPPPPLDFHQILTLLADHPQLLRQLGLVVDLEIPAGSLPLSASGQPDPKQLQVLPTFAAPLSARSVSPFTAYVLEGDRFFEPAPDPGRPEVLHGLLNMHPGGPFEAFQLDVDGSALKMLATFAQGAADPVDGAARGVGVPAMRSAGVTISHAQRAQLMAERFARTSNNNAALAAPEPPALFAEDLVRGYRVDVFDLQAGTWRSLHRRVGTYTFKAHPGGPLTLTIQGEGAVQPTATHPVGADGVNPDPDAELYIHESLAHWQGWSLAAPRPGKTITDNGPGTVSNQAPPGHPQLEVSFKAEPATLPRLRFGHRYQFRARTVDLAGNGLSVDEATVLLDVLEQLLHQSPPVLPGGGGQFTYRRFEPVAAPVVVPREHFNEGESLERLVIRSRTGVGTADEARALTALGGQAGPRYRATSERHIAAPKTSQSMVETLGMLDASFGTQVGFQQTYNLARKEKGKLTDTSIIDIATGQPVPIPDTVEVDPGTGQTINRPSVEIVVTGNTARGEAGYALHHEPQLQLPYLPDPLSQGAALFGLPGVPASRPAGVLDAAGNLVFVASALPSEIIGLLGGSTLHIGFAGGWPARLPFRVVLAEPPSTGSPTPAPAWDPHLRTLTVFLAQAEQASFRLSSFLAPDDLGRLGMWQWLTEMQAPDAGTLQAALEGARWQITPGRTISLVHAVEQPLRAPDLSALRATRDAETTFAYLGAQIAVHGKSTAKLDLLASWTEPMDSPGGPPPTSLDREAHVFEIPIELPDEVVEQPPEDPSIVPLATYDAAADVVTLQGRFPGDESGRTFLSRHEFGDTAYRKVTYQALATSRFREYFPPQVTGDPARLTLRGSAVSIDVLSSARPAAPGVVSVLPSFEWSRTAQPDGRRLSVRNGGVRVYLDRPWFSSGEGELLGVVLTDLLNYPPVGARAGLAPFVTHWGRDPIWGSHDIVSPPQALSFPRAVATGTSLSLDELQLIRSTLPDGAERVQVAGHAVSFDTGRGLWFCDIQVRGAPDETYAPFLRLALARYQPKSILGAELSPVVLADFVQVPAPRTVTLAPTGQADVFELRVEGPSSGPGMVPAGADLVEVAVEERMPGTADELGWAPAASPEIRVQPSSALKAGAPLVLPVPPLWEGAVRLPHQRTAGQLRVVIREHEHLMADPGPDEPAGAPGSGARRLVFAETITV